MIIRRTLVGKTKIRLEGGSEVGGGSRGTVAVFFVRLRRRRRAGYMRD